MWREVFHGLDTKKVVSVSIDGDDHHTRELELTFDDSTKLSAPQNPFGLVNFPSPARFSYKADNTQWQVTPQFINGNYQWLGVQGSPLDAAFFPSTANYNSTEIADRFTKAVMTGFEREVVDAISEQFSFITSIKILFVAGLSVLYVETPWFDEPVPLNSISAGVAKFVSYILTISAMENGVVLIDEIENGFYFDKMPSIWRSLFRLAKKHNVQIFASGTRLTVESD